jgi:hypothetical protein
MRIKTTAAIVIIAGLIIGIFSQFIAILYAPHNARTTYPVEAVTVKPWCLTYLCVKLGNFI